METLLFASSAYEKYDADLTLPAKFRRLLKETGLAERVKDKRVAIKMHVGRGIGFTTIHPMFVRILADQLKEWGARPFATDQTVEGAVSRGYTQEALGIPVVDVLSVTGKYFYERHVDFKSLKNVDVAGCIHDADFMIDLSHVKGHGVCGYGGACKNIAMGCVTDRTRSQIHGLEGTCLWNEDACIYCDACIKSCNHYANHFTEDKKYRINLHHCTNCQHCAKVCPTGAIEMTARNYEDFQIGMAIATKEVLDCLDGNYYFINFLTDITAICDCWGFSTPALVPDIGIIAGNDIVAVEQACLDQIKIENLNPMGVPGGRDLSDLEGHLFQRLHGKDPFVQLDQLALRGLGSREYELKEIK